MKMEWSLVGLSPTNGHPGLENGLSNQLTDRKLYEKWTLWTQHCESIVTVKKRGAWS